MFKTKDESLSYFKGSNYKIHKFNKNDIIALEGSPCDKVGLVLAGSVDIKRIITGSNTIHMSSLSVGNFFGEVIAFSNTNTYPATVMASTNCEVMFIKRDDFIIFCSKNIEFLSSFLNDLTNKIINLNKSIKGLSFTSIRQKLCNFLISEYETQNTHFIKLNMTKQKLSEVLGVPRPSLSRELINMKNDGIIDYSKDVIKILDFDFLEDILMS